MRRLTTIITTFIFCLFATIILYPSVVKADGAHFVSMIDVTDLNGPEDGHDHSIWVYHENDDNFLESYGGISYNPTTNVLTLNNVNGPGYFLMISGDYGSPTEVEIKVVGDNKLKGLWCFSSGVKFTGTGTLTIDQSATTTLDAATYTFNALNAIYIHQVEDKKLTIEKTVTLHLKSGTPGLGSGEGVIAVEGMTHQTLDSFLVYGGVVTPDMDTVFSANDEQIFIQNTELSFVGSIPASDLKVSGVKEKYYCTGEAIKPEPTITLATDENTVLKKGTDYTLSYKDNKNIGNATLTITFKGNYSGKKTVKFTIEPPKKGTAFTVSGLKYKVADAKKKTVNVTGATKKDITKLTVGDTVKIGGKRYKIVGINDKAFAKYKKLKTVVLGANIAEIGEEAFAQCEKLETFNCKSTVLTKIDAKAFYGNKKQKSITFKSKKIKKVGKKAFTKIPSKAVIKVNASMVKKYTKLFRNGGLSVKVKVTKNK